MPVRKQKAKALIARTRRGIPKEVIKRRLEEIFGKGSSKEIETATTVDKCIEIIEIITNREEQFEEWEKMRREVRKRQWEDRRLNLFWRKNKTFPTQFGGDEETPKEETLGFWRRINNKEVSEGWRDDRDIRGALYEGKMLLQKGRRCRWDPFTEEEFDEVLRCTAPWKACSVDSVNSFTIKNCHPIRKVVFRL